jgi:hypothetical protein
MKFIHSFVPVNYDPKKPSTKIIWKELIYPQLLSALLIKKLYGNIHFYTNDSVANQIKDIGIPYDSIDTEILNKQTSKTFSYFKLKVFEAQTEPYVHIDTDTILFKKYVFNKNSEDVALYAHLDQPTNDIKNPNIHVKTLEILTKTYLGLFYLLEKSHSEFKKAAFNVLNIPNMNITAVLDPNAFQYATKKSLLHYEKNKDVIDGFEYGACYIEQLMIHLNLMEISAEYTKAVESFNHVLSWKRFLNIVESKKEDDVPFSVSDYGFPLTMLISPINNKFIDLSENNSFLNYEIFNEKTIKIPSEEKLNDFFSFDFYGVHHLSFMKWSPIFQCLVIGYIAKHFGEDWLYIVNNYFKTIYPDLKLPILSDGEKLYEKISGFKFNKTNKII